MSDPSSTVSARELMELIALWKAEPRSNFYRVCVELRQLRELHDLIAALKVAAGTDAEGDDLVLRVRQLRMAQEDKARMDFLCSMQSLGKVRVQVWTDGFKSKWNAADDIEPSWETLTGDSIRQAIPDGTDHE